MSTTETEILRDGTPALAIVTGLPSPVDEDRCALQILLEVQLPAQRAYEVNYIFPLARMWSGLVLGMELPVRVDPVDRHRIAVQWEDRTD